MQQCLKVIPKLQNEILDSMLTVCPQEIKDQVNENEFFAIQFYEMFAISNHCNYIYTMERSMKCSGLS